MENKNIDEIENKEEIKINTKKIIDNNIPEKKGNRLCDDKQRKKKRKKEKKAKDAQDPNKKIKFSKKKIVLTILIALAVLILIIGVVVGTYIYKADGNITTAALNMAADVLGEDDPIFILVLGISEDIKAPLTDTIILTGYNPDSQKAFMLSIPRDTFVGTGEAWASGYDKINALYQSGPEKTVAAVEKLTGIDIANYVIVKNSALPAIVSAIGEVEFDVPIDMDYDDPTQDLHIHLKAGIQMIDGDEAEQLLRFRHNNDGSSYPTEYGDNDYGRMRTQREFIKAVASQLVIGNNLSKVKEIGTAVFNNVETDMSLGKMLGYAPSALKLDVSGVRMEQLPGASSKINNLWFYKHDSTETYELVNELLLELNLDEKEMEDLYTPTKKVKNSSSNKKTNTIAENKLTTNENTNSGTTNTTITHTHSHTSKVTLKATCTEKGERVYTCNCGNTYAEPIPAMGHNIETKQTVSGKTTVITKTCKNEGCNYKEETKKNEDENAQENKDNDKKPTDTHKHSYTETVSSTPATCKSKGSKTLKCSCGETKTESIDKLAHTEGTADANGKVVCTECGIVIKEGKPQHEHSYKTETIDATCTTDGSTTEKCSCGDVKSQQTLPATGHTPGEPDATTGEVKCVTCGNPIV